MGMTVTEAMQADRATAVYECSNCGHVYLPERGDPDGGVRPGTPFDAIPDDWVCPVCGARKADYVKMRPGQEITEAALA
jgi:rubredoxin